MKKTFSIHARSNLSADNTSVRKLTPLSHKNYIPALVSRLSQLNRANSMRFRNTTETSPLPKTTLLKLDAFTIRTSPRTNEEDKCLTGGLITFS